jgi:hypothetical protein
MKGTFSLDCSVLTIAFIISCLLPRSAMFLLFLFLRSNANIIGPHHRGEQKSVK